MITLSARVLIVADDLTGANDSAVQFASFGAKAITLLDLTSREEIANLRSRFQVLSLSTESRNVGTRGADAAVRRLLPDALVGFEPDILFKKIDSTLRGNIEAELQACESVVGQKRGIPIVLTPAYPSNGRAVCGGYVLVHGVPLARTFAGRDFLAPVKSSRVSDVFLEWHDRVGELGLAAFEGGEGALRRSLEELSAAGKDLILVDALDQEDLNKLVSVAAPLFSRAIWAGSAGLSEALAGYLAGSAVAPVLESVPEPAAGRPKRDVLILYGSLNPASSDQVDCARQKGSCQVIYAPNSLDVDETSVALSRHEGSVAVVSAHVNTAGTPEETSVRVKAYFAEVARKAVVSGRFSSMVLSGGDVGRAVLAALRASAVTVEAEIIPGVVFSRVYDGLAAGMGVVTKAGGFGDREALSKVLAWLGSAEF